MNRREFVKLATASVTLAAIPVSLVALVKPEDIKWHIHQEPSYGYAWRIMGEAEIEGVPYIDSEIFELSDDGSEEQMIARCKKSILMRFERTRNRRAL